MNNTLVSPEESLANREWITTSDLWKRLANDMGHALIRVKPCGKIPNEGKGWQQIGHRPFGTISFNQEDNAGVVTGKQSGIIVLDVDDEALFSQACRTNSWDVPETFTVKTGKGYHYYYKLPTGDKEYRNRSKKLEGWDIRANDGYVVAPGSIHPGGSIYTVANDRGFSAAPDWLLQKSLEVAADGSEAIKTRKLGNRKGNSAPIVFGIDFAIISMRSRAVATA